MTVSELIAALQEYPPEAEVLATWEGTIKEIEVYRSKDGHILIDADAGFYRHEFETIAGAVEKHR